MKPSRPRASALATHPEGQARATRTIWGWLNGQAHCRQMIDLCLFSRANQRLLACTPFLLQSMSRVVRPTGQGQVPRTTRQGQVPGALMLEGGFAQDFAGGFAVPSQV
jgi:hypothetical protein